MHALPRITTLSALALLLALPVHAQQAAGDPAAATPTPGVQTTDPTLNPTGEISPMPNARQATMPPPLPHQAESAMLPPAPGLPTGGAGLEVDRAAVQKASDLIGMSVENRAGKKLGDISDLAIEPQTGRIAYVALQVNDVLGFGGKLIAVPLSALTLQPDSEKVILDASETALNQASGFDDENWPTQANAQWLSGAGATTATAELPSGPEATAHTRMAGQAAEIVITNPMPHPMNVMADWGQGSQTLGSVLPNETKNFELTAPADAQVRLTATDEANTHSPSGTVTLDPANPATWTIR